MLLTACQCCRFGRCSSRAAAEYRKEALLLRHAEYVTYTTGAHICVLRLVAYNGYRDTCFYVIRTN